MQWTCDGCLFEQRLGPGKGRGAWEEIVEFMAGAKPSECPPEKRNEPGTEKCIAIVYQGLDAVRKIRDVLGPTPSAAEVFATGDRKLFQPPGASHMTVRMATIRN